MALNFFNYKNWSLNPRTPVPPTPPVQSPLMNSLRNVYSNVSPTTQQNALNNAVQPQVANQPTPIVNAIPGASSAPVPTSVQPNNPDLSQFGTSLNNLKTQAEALQKSINSQATPTTPTTPQNSYADLQKQYLGQLTPSDQENALNTRINSLLGNQESSNILVGGEPISAGAMQGRRASLDRETQAQLLPLQRQLGLEQTKRQAALDVSKANMELAKPTAFDLSPGQERYQYNPQTGKTEKVAGAAQTPSQQYGTGAIGEYLFAQSQGYTGSFSQYQNEDANRKARASGGGNMTSLLTALATNPDVFNSLTPTLKSQALQAGYVPPSKQSFQSQVATQGRQAVKGLLTIAEANPEVFGRSASLPIPDYLRSDAFRNYKAQLDYLKGNVIPAALTAMREASKTGGALGQVSDREGAWLGSSLGALDMAQSPQQVQDQLKLIDASLERWESAVKTQGGTGTQDPQIQQLKDAGYSDEQIQQILNS